MKKTLITLSAVVAAVFAAQGALAQDKARADVKAEAKDAVKAGTVQKGEGPAAADKPAKGATARADVKKEAAAAEKAGTVQKGEGPAAEKKPTSTKERAEVKKEAAAAVKAGETGKGEGPAPAKK
jgi:adenylosuccinate synthase